MRLDDQTSACLIDERVLLAAVSSLIGIAAASSLAEDSDTTPHSPLAD